MKFVSKSFLQSVRISQIVINTLVIALEFALVISLHRTDYKLNNNGLGLGLIHVFRFSIGFLSFAFIAFSFRRFSHRWNVGQIKKDIYIDTFLALAWSLSSISNTIPLVYQEDQVCEIYDDKEACDKIDMTLILFSWLMSILLLVSALITTKRWRRYTMMILKLHNPNTSSNNNHNNFKTTTISTSPSATTSAANTYNITTSPKSPIGTGIGAGSGLGNGILATASLTSSSSASTTTTSASSTPNSKVVMQEGVLENGQPVLFFHQNNLHMFSQKNISTTTLNNNNNNNNK